MSSRCSCASDASEASELVAEETGKPIELARGETDAAVEMGLFVAGEGRRSYGRTTTASMAHRTVLTLRQPLGVAGLIMSFNTPLPNVAWKAFPAVFCGNAAVVKPSEHTPASAWLFGELAREAGLPDGVLNVVQGTGPEAGAPLVEHEDVDLVSFTGSAATGRWINETAGQAAREGLPRAGREERARRLRRRRARERGALGTRLCILERRSAMCFGKPARRVRRRVRGVPGAARSRRTRASSGAGDQRGEPRPHPRGDRARGLRGRDRPRGRRASRPPGWHLAPTVLEGASSRCRDLVHGAVRAR